MSADWIAFAVLAFGAVLALVSAPAALAQPIEPPLALLRRAYERTFEQPGVRAVDLRVWRSGRLVARRSFEMALRREGDSARTLVRFTEPEYLRGHALLVVAAHGGPSDTWLYQPEERRARRVAFTQRGDSFYGSDLSLEDLERPRWRRWRATRAGDAEEAGRTCAVVDAEPSAESQYARLRVWIDRERLGVRRIDFFRRSAAPADSDALLKRMWIELADAAEQRGFLRVAAIAVEPFGRDGRTEILIRRMEINPAIADRIFSATRLEREGEGLFELLDRAPEDPQ